MIRHLVPVPDKDPRHQLGEILQRCRIEFNLSIGDVARRIGASHDEVKAWEAGESVPRGKQWPRLKGSFNRLAGASAIWQAALRVDEADDENVDEIVRIAEDATIPPQAELLPPVVGDLPELVDPRSESSWGKALARARLNEGVSQREVGDLLDVGQSQLSNWERGENAPVRAHYEKLLEIFPVLREVHPPPVRDIDKPVGYHGPSPLGRPPGVPQPAPLLAPPIPAPKPSRLEIAPPPRAEALTQPDALSGLDPVALAGVVYARAMANLARATEDVAEAERELADAKAQRDAAKETVTEALAELEEAIRR